MKSKTNLKLAVILVFFYVTMWSGSAAGRPIYVDANAPPGGDGSSWATAYKYLQDALADADSNPDPNDIWVAESVYAPDSNAAEPNGTGDRTATFQLISGVGLYGGFPSGGGAWETRDPEAHETILSGDLGGDDVGDANRGENSYHVVTASGTDANAVLDGFTITAGNANGSGRDTGGGGMYNESGEPTVANCIFSGNYAQVGGGIVNDSASPTLTNCRVNDNWAADGGGGIRNHNSSPNLVCCTLTGNSTLGFGGGMENTSSSSPTLINCTLSGNSAVSSGGGIRNYGGNLTLINCVLSGNSTNEVGGGIWNYSGCTVNMTNCTFAGNSTSFGRALACESYLNPSTVQISNCILWDGGSEILNYDSSTITVSYSDVQGGWGGPGGNNIDADPCFVDANGLDGEIGTEDDNLRLPVGSACIDAGASAAVPPDTADLDNDGNTAERTPLDLDYGQRFADDPCTVDSGVPDPPAYPYVVDMGAYEYRYYSNTCWDQSVCAGQPFGDASCDGQVNLDDLAALKAAWGMSSPYANPYCCADFTQDGQVNLDDLAALKAGWGGCCHIPSTGSQSCPP